MISNGIPDDAFSRVVREDPKRKGLLYAGTETGMYISFDDGKNWQSFQLNLPIVPITDLAVKENDLVVGTQGRSFWILDDLTPLHQLSDKIAKSSSHLYEPRITYRMGGGSRWGGSSSAGENPPNGVMTFFYLKDEIAKDDTITLEYMEINGDVIKTFSNIISVFGSPDLAPISKYNLVKSPLPPPPEARRAPLTDIPVPATAVAT